MIHPHIKPNTKSTSGIIPIRTPFSLSWKVMVQFPGASKSVQLGIFDSESEAATAFIIAKKQWSCS